MFYLSVSANVLVNINAPCFRSLVEITTNSLTLSMLILRIFIRFELCIDSVLRKKLSFCTLIESHLFNLCYHVVNAIKLMPIVLALYIH